MELTRPFYMGVHPVTQEEYEKVMGKNPSNFRKGGEGEDNVKDLDPKQFPVESVSWEDATAFCEALNKQDKQKPAGWVYRLPTEAEWEYACRAGTTTAYSFGDDYKAMDDYAWYQTNSGGHTHRVGGKKPNSWGLYDMHGNVWQWCADRYGRYEERSIKDPIGTGYENSHIMRGGSWGDGPGRSARRVFLGPGVRDRYNGFRVVLRPDVLGP